MFLITFLSLKSQTMKVKNMKILFARIGWMKFYSGSQPGDERPIGEYNKKHKGGEIYNFKSFGSYLYGAFAVQYPQKLKFI